MPVNHTIRHRDGAPKIYQSPAISGQYLYFTSRSDDIENNIVGKGNQLFIDNSPGNNKKVVEAQFLEDIQLKDAYLLWEGAIWGDNLDIEVVLPASVPFESLGNKGNARIINNVPTYITASQSPDETWTGTHLFFPIDVILIRFVNGFMINGTNNVSTVLESQGVAMIKKELKLRMTLNSPSSNANIKVSVSCEMYRTRTT